jgi:hypothetical protein
LTELLGGWLDDLTTQQVRPSCSAGAASRTCSCVNGLLTIHDIGRSTTTGSKK